MSQSPARINDLRPGMDGVTIKVKVLQISPAREVTTRIGRFHKLADGVVEDESGNMAITFWDDQLEHLQALDLGDFVRISNCFVSSFKGERRINVGRDSNIEKISKL